MRHEEFHKQDAPALGLPARALSWKKDYSTFKDPEIAKKLKNGPLMRWKVLVHCEKMVEFDSKIVLDLLQTVLKRIQVDEPMTLNEKIRNKELEKMEVHQRLSLPKKAAQEEVK